MSEIKASKARVVDCRLRLGQAVTVDVEALDGKPVKPKGKRIKAKIQDVYPLLGAATSYQLIGKGVPGIWVRADRVKKQ